MINHVSIGVCDITRAKAFYDAVLKPLGYACLSSNDTSINYYAAFAVDPDGYRVEAYCDKPA